MFVKNRKSDRKFIVVLMVKDKNSIGYSPLGFYDSREEALDDLEFILNPKVPGGRNDIDSFFTLGFWTYCGSDLDINEHTVYCDSHPILRIASKLYSIKNSPVNMAIKKSFTKECFPKIYSKGV